jgi:RsiW-degrading membrane proteinase PrsW (M82 family)
VNWNLKHEEVDVQTAVSTAESETQAAPPIPSGRSFWRSVIWAVVGLLIFVAFFNLIGPALPLAVDDGLIVLGLLMSLVPAVLWLVVFYRVDAAEPEPKRMVALVFAGGLVLAAAAYPWLLGTVYETGAWLTRYWWSQLLGGIVVVGFLNMGIVYLAVRVLAMSLPEFDERLDGIIYATAAGLGVATVVNFGYVLEHGGVDLGIGSARMVTNALGYASIAGVLGYFLGQARFEHTPWYYLPAGVTLTAVLDGVLFFLIGRTGSGGFTSGAWGDLAIALAFAVAAGLVLTWLVRRTNEETRRVARLTPSGDAWEPLPPQPEDQPTAGASVNQGGD